MEGDSYTKFVSPLIVSWYPKEDITVYELALCLPFFSKRHIMPWEIDLSQPFTRHFNIVDPNKPNKEEDLK